MDTRSPSASAGEEAGPTLCVPRDDPSGRRSNVVGTASPTSPPRWPSRHCTAPGKGLRLSWRPPQRRWRPADGDLRRPAGGGDQRQARVSERSTRGLPPALQRRPPARRLERGRPGADPATNLSDRLPDDRPQRQRHRDRGLAVVPSGCDPARHDRQNRIAAHAAVAPARDDDPRRRPRHISWTTELAIANPVTVQPEPAAYAPARGTAVGACARPCAFGGWRRCEPPLDVERVMKDSWSASGRFRHWARPGARRRRCWRTVDVTYFLASPTLNSGRSRDRSTSTIRTGANRRR